MDWKSSATFGGITAVVSGMLQYFMTGGVSGWVPLLSGLITAILAPLLFRLWNRLITSGTPVTLGIADVPRLNRLPDPKTPRHIDPLLTRSDITIGEATLPDGTILKDVHGDAPITAQDQLEDLELRMLKFIAEEFREGQDVDTFSFFGSSQLLNDSPHAIKQSFLYLKNEGYIVATEEGFDRPYRAPVIPPFKIQTVTEKGRRAITMGQVQN